MKQWQALSGPYTTPQGYVVEPVISQDGLYGLGTHFNNGLSAHHDIYAGFCVDGKCQIVRVMDPDGEMVANSELRVQRGDVKVMFTRGHNNEEFAPGTPEMDAVLNYVGAVNSKHVPVNLEIANDGFVGSGELTPWQQALADAQVSEISPFMALVAGTYIPNENAPEGGSVLLPAVTEWETLSGSYKATNGVVVEPVGTLDGLKKIGFELENMLIVPDAAVEMARVCNEGQTQFAVIYTEEDGVIGFAQFSVVDGKLNIMGARGYAEEPLSEDADTALRDYVECINDKNIETAIDLDGNVFRTANAITHNSYGEPIYPYDLPVAQRTAGVGYDGDYDDEDLEDGWDDEEEDDFDNADGAYTIDEFEQINLPYWTPLTEETFVAENGYQVDIISNKEAAKEMGVALLNALGTDYFLRDYARSANKGNVQIARVRDAQGNLVSNAELKVRDGGVVISFNRGRQNVSADEVDGDAVEALVCFVNAVNAGELPLAAEPEGNIFVTSAVIAYRADEAEEAEDLEDESDLSGPKM